MQRQRFIRDYLTDFYFAHNLPIELLHTSSTTWWACVRPRTRDELRFNPELAPLDMLLNKAQQYELLPEDASREIQHHIEEIIVVWSAP